MARKPSGEPNGRPPIEINPKEFEGMCKVHCTKEEMASILSCDEKTIDAWCKRHYGETFSVCYKRFSDGGKMSLRRTMWKMATVENNPTMCIFLAKAELGMKDKVEVEHSGTMTTLTAPLSVAEAKRRLKEIEDSL